MSRKNEIDEAIEKTVKRRNLWILRNVMCSGEYVSEKLSVFEGQTFNVSIRSKDFFSKFGTPVSDMCHNDFVGGEFSYKYMGFDYDFYDDDVWNHIFWVGEDELFVTDSDGRRFDVNDFILRPSPVRGIRMNEFEDELVFLGKVVLEPDGSFDNLSQFV